MANNISSLVEEKYSKNVQTLLEDNLVWLKLGNTRLMAQMPDGNRINVPRVNYMGTEQYVKYTDVVDKDIKTENEYLEINKHPIISFTIDIEDEQDIGYDLIAPQVRRNAYQLASEIDWDFFNEYKNAGANNGTAVSLTTGNVMATYSNANAELLNTGSMNALALVVSPFQHAIITQSSQGNTFKVADTGFKNWDTWTEYLWMRIFVSNNLTTEWALAIGTNPTDWDTVSINGVVFTFKSTIATAWDVEIGWDVATSITNLVNAINGGTGAGTTYVDFTDSTRPNKLVGLTATATASWLTLVSKRGYKKVSSNLQDSADKWGALTIHNLIMEKGAIDFVLRNKVITKVEDVQKQLGKRFMTHTRYGIKTFTDWAEKMFDVRVQAQPAE